MVRSLVVLFLLLCSGYAQAQGFGAVQIRNGLINVFARMKAGEPTTIAYFGGSITEGAGASDADKTSWRAQTTAWFKRQYPKSAITEINAAIGGTGSALGAFRLQRDVLDKKPDLVFVEFAVNDMGTPADQIERAMEGIVRQIRTANPYTEICFVYTLHQEMLPDYKFAKMPPTVFRHEIIAAHYRITSINLGSVVAEQINSGKLAWGDFSKDVCHPTDAGYALYTDTMTAFLADQSLHVSRPPIAYPLTIPLRTDSWAGGNLKEAAALSALPAGWSREAPPFREGWPNALAANSPEAAPLTFAFTGDTIGLYYLLGPDTGNLDYKIDGADWQALKPFDEFALQYARPQYRLLDDHLKPGDHTLTVRIRADKDARSKGTWTRLAFFMTNAPPPHAHAARKRAEGGEATQIAYNPSRTPPRP